MTADQRLRARLLWLAGADTAEIARRLDLPEHVVANDREWSRVAKRLADGESRRVFGRALA